MDTETWFAPKSSAGTQDAFLMVPHPSCFEQRNISTCLEVSLQLHLQVDRAAHSMKLKRHQ